MRLYDIRGTQGFMTFVKLNVATNLRKMSGLCHECHEFLYLLGCQNPTCD